MYVTVEGVPYVMQDGDVDVPSTLLSATYERVKCIAALGQERRELDMVARRAKGGGLRLRMQDDGDHTLRSLFTMRKRRTTFIGANVGAGAVTITVKSTGAFAASGNFWCGGECVSYTGKTATTFTGCTRAAFGTTARAFRGGASNGQAVYASPPSWLGRIVTLKGYFLDHDGEAPASTSMQATLGTFEIDSAPQYLGDDTWEMSAIDRIDSFLKRAIYTGIEPTTETNLLRYEPDGVDYGEGRVFVSNNGFARLFGDNDTPGDFAYVHLDGVGVYGSGVTGNLSLLIRATNLDLGLLSESPRADLSVPITTEPGLNRSMRFMATTSQAFSNGGAFYESAKPAAYLREKADTLALKVLHSRTGNGTNGTHDVLMGKDASVSSDTDPDGFMWRIGAGILAAEVDANSLAAVGASVEWFFLLDEPMTVGDFARDFCMATDAFTLTNLNGQLSVKSMSDGPSALVQMVIDDDQVIGKATATYDESSVFPHVVLECSYDPRVQAFKERVEINDAEMAERYPTRDETLTIESKSIFIAGLWAEDFWLDVPAYPLAEVQRRLRRYQCEEGGRGSLYVDVKVHIDAALLNLGDIVTLNLDDVPDMEGSTITNRRARVVSHLTNWDEGTVDMRLQVLRPPKRIGSASIIASTASADTVLTLTTAQPECGNTAAFLFGVGNAVIVWDVSGNVSHATTLTAVGPGNTVTLATAPGFAVAGTVDFITHGTATVGDLTPTTNDYVPLTDFIFQVDDDEREYEDAVPDAGESRWR